MTSVCAEKKNDLSDLVNHKFSVLFIFFDTIEVTNRHTHHIESVKNN